MHLRYVTLWTGCGLSRGVLTNMRLLALLFTAIAHRVPRRGAADAASPQQDGTRDESTKDQGPRCRCRSRKFARRSRRRRLLSLRTVDERPTFRIQIQEKQKLEELLATLNFKAGAGAGRRRLHGRAEPDHVSVGRQPAAPARSAAFNQSELLTILIENLVGKYLGGKALNAISKAERASAEAAARDEVRSAIAQYCGSQPNAGAGIQICDTPVR